MRIDRVLKHEGKITRELGARSGKTILSDFLRKVRPSPSPNFEVRFETPDGRQAQVDFAEFKVEFARKQVARKVWLFAMVLGHSRYPWAQYVMHHDLPTVLRCHMEAFEHFGDVPHEILYDRMKTAVLGEPDEDQLIVYNAKPLACGAHYGFVPRACQPYRAQTNGKVERPYRYIRADFFMARRFLDLEDMNRQLRHWLDTVANARLHGTTDRIVVEHFHEERPALRALPCGRFEAVIHLQRSLSHDGCVSVGSNYYGVPDGTRRRVPGVETTPDQVRIHEDDGRLIALQAARLTTVKSLWGCDFSFQPSMDRHRVLALAELEFIERKKYVHFLGPPGTGKSHLRSPCASRR